MPGGKEILYWDRKTETLPRDKILGLQWARLRQRLWYIYERSPLYRRRLREIGLDPSEVKGLEDFKGLVPMTTKEELRKEREDKRDLFGGLLCVPREEVAFLVRTAGTTGTPSVYGLTQGDVRMAGELMARSLYQVGARKGHLMACATMGTWNYFAKELMEGLRTAGMTTYHFAMPVAEEEVFPIEVLSQWMQIHGFYLSARPLQQVTEKYGERLKILLPDLRYVLTAGQRLTKAFRQGMESLWGAPLYEAYPMTDVGMPCVTCTEQHDTFHFAEDLFLVEVLDPQTGRDLTGSRQVGELVVTPLASEGTPILRFRTGDMGFTITEPCPCGRTQMRLGVTERTAHGVQVKGRVIFSHEVEEVLYALPELLFRPYHLVKKREQPQERLIVRVERPDHVRSVEDFRVGLAARLRDAIGVETEVELVSRQDERFVVGYKHLRVVEE